MSAATVQKADSYGMREAGRYADLPPGAKCLVDHQEGKENVIASGSTSHASQLPVVSTVALTVSNTGSGNLHAPFCTFCGIGADCGNTRQQPPLCISAGIVYHTLCALWCPEVFYNTELDVLRGIAEAAHRSRFIKCAWCRRPGAAVGCAWPICQLRFHIPCAVKARASMKAHACVLHCPFYRSAAVVITAVDLLEFLGSKAALKTTKP
ncbi:putative PHD-zinc-finger like domain/PHD-like zinc-binding domain containing protein [Leishmania naiffi]|uniref:PHD-zinc-finger like domain/PHD-like zinc-binding domain containing protein n=1 Tax=Leishmania naiffi TaxID=5678 RepID=A0AAW3B993_9TRYP